MDLFLLGQKSQESVRASPAPSCVTPSEPLNPSQALFLCLWNEGSNIHLLSFLSNSGDQIQSHQACELIWQTEKNFLMQT